ncbi:hypothetical protein [Neisseria sp. CCUG12390]|uniref:hypothetical protein n=1 Tax=Neisseria sp. CCUG12390 TaxID=3392035 RepID=UPI003A0FC773
MKKLSALLCLMPLAACMSAGSPEQSSDYPQGTYEVKVFERDGRQVSRGARLPVREYELDATLDAVCRIHAGKSVTARVYSPNGQEFTTVSPRHCR